MSGEARRRLASPSEFRPVFQASAPQSDALYAVVPQARVGPAPAPSSFRAFAQLAAGRRVLISSATHPLERLPLYYTLRSSDGLYGEWGDPGHFRRDVQIRPPTGEAVDLIALPDSLYPSPLDPAHRAPAWAGGDVRLYDLTIPIPGPTAAAPIHVDGRSLLDASGIQITSLPGWSDSWTGTDWVLYRETEPSTGIPAVLERGQRWFPGQLAPQNPGQRIAIRFDASRRRLEHQGADGAWSAVGDAGRRASRRLLCADAAILDGWVARCSSCQIAVSGFGWERPRTTSFSRLATSLSADHFMLGPLSTSNPYWWTIRSTLRSENRRSAITACSLALRSQFGAIRQAWPAALS